MIHASKTPDKKAMKEFGFETLPVGVIVGKAVLRDVRHYRSSKELMKDKNLHLASEKWGKYGFVLENVQRVKELPCKGSLNFWEFKK